MTIKTINDRVEQYKDVHWLLAADLSLELAKQVFDKVPINREYLNAEELAIPIHELLLGNVFEYVFDGKSIYWDFAVYNNKGYITISTTNEPMTIKKVMENYLCWYNFPSNYVVLSDGLYSGVIHNHTEG